MRTVTLSRHFSGLPVEAADAFANRAMTWLRAGEPDLALQHALLARAADPYHVLGRASEGLAWRAVGDDRRAQEVFDYDALLHVLPLGDDRAGLSHALMRELSQRTDLEWERAGVATVGGWQTRNILEDPSPAIAAIARRVLAVIRGVLGPLAGRDRYLDTNRVRLRRADAVVLGCGGYQREHVHEHGYFSAVYYLRVPLSCQTGENGQLVFGRRGRPDHVVRPREGDLVVFPSYFFHWTTRLTCTEPRVSLAFDVVRELE